MSNPFEEWLIAQYKLETESFGNDPPRLNPEVRKDFARWNAYALEDELHEATQEVAWKPWADSTHFNREAFIKEMVDVLFFAGNLILMATQCYTGEFITRSGETIPEYTDVRGLADEVWAEYQAKVEVNAARMREGYDGVSTKCPICKREMRQPDEGQPYCLEHGLPGGAR